MQPSGGKGRGASQVPYRRIQPRDHHQQARSPFKSASHVNGIPSSFTNLQQYVLVVSLFANAAFADDVFHQSEHGIYDNLCNGFLYTTPKSAYWSKNI
jgi:hypothetical protein